jgi:hypothetical protein
MATLDWAGHDFQQINTIPFVLLTNDITTLCSKGTTDAGIQKFFNIARVTKQLIVDYNMKTVNEDFQNWLKYPPTVRATQSRASSSSSSSSSS